MSIKFHCNKCGVSVKAPDSYAGKRVKCPKCQSLNSLPAESEALPYQLEVEVQDYDGIFCQHCGTKIKREAIYCPKCGCENKINKTANPLESSSGNISGGTIGGAYFLSIVIPLFGIIAGIYLMVKKEIFHGLMCIILSVFVGIPMSVFLWGIPI
jgi:phage FluMu protein Com